MSAVDVCVVHVGRIIQPQSCEGRSDAGQGDNVCDMHKESDKAVEVGYVYVRLMHVCKKIFSMLVISPVLSSVRMTTTSSQHR